jgi:hypothetical protein
VIRHRIRGASAYCRWGGYVDGKHEFVDMGVGGGVVWSWIAEDRRVPDSSGQKPSPFANRGSNVRLLEIIDLN